MATQPIEVEVTINTEQAKRIIEEANIILFRQRDEFRVLLKAVIEGKDRASMTKEIVAALLESFDLIFGIEK